MGARKLGLPEVVVILNNRIFHSFHHAFLLWSKAFYMISAVIHEFILIFLDKWEVSVQLNLKEIPANFSSWLWRSKKNIYSE